MEEARLAKHTGVRVPDLSPLTEFYCYFRITLLRCFFFLFIFFCLLIYVCSVRSGVKSRQELSYALNLLVLLLPIEHRCTLKALVTFLKLIVTNQAANKMSIHNVAMIVAPSLFPPRYVHPRDRTDLTAQVNMAAICCQVTEALLSNADTLWYVPNDLINQLHRQSEEERYRKYKKKYY